MRDQRLHRLECLALGALGRGDARPGVLLKRGSGGQGRRIARLGRGWRARTAAAAGPCGLGGLVLVGLRAEHVEGLLDHAGRVDALGARVDQLARHDTHDFGMDSF